MIERKQWGLYRVRAVLQQGWPMSMRTFFVIAAGKEAAKWELTQQCWDIVDRLTRVKKIGYGYGGEDGPRVFFNERL